MNPESIAQALGGARRSGSTWLARCPLSEEHQRGDANPSLSVTTRDGKILVHCHSRHAQQQERVIDALKTRGLWLGSESARGWREIVTTYDYRNENGALIYQAVRYVPKDFLQRRPDGRGSWIWNLDGVHRVLYHLPELLAASPDEIVFIVEGEKDADALAARGLVATTNPGGAGKWRDEYNEYFRDRSVALLPDNDETGEKHAAQVARELLLVAKTFRTIRLPNLPEKGDVSDWLAAGGTTERLIELVKQTPPVGKDSSARSFDGPLEDARGIRFRTVETYLADRQEQSSRRCYWAQVLRAGEVSMLAGRAYAGKSTFAGALTRALIFGLPLLV
jgi:hypothetical protein